MEACAWCMVEDLACHLEYWIALLPERQQKNLIAWLERHSRIVCGRAVDDVREFLAAVHNGRSVTEAFIVLGEIAWQWRHIVSQSEEVCADESR